MSATRNCEYCGSIGMPDGNGGTKKLRKCGRCYRIRYCNREHQKADHQRHKPDCLAFVEAKQEKRDKKAHATSSSSDSSSSEEEEEKKRNQLKLKLLLKILDVCGMPVSMVDWMKYDLYWIWME